MAVPLHNQNQSANTYLFTGGWGKLGTCLQPLLPNISPHKNEMDILDEKRIRSYVTAYNPVAIVHMAAITKRDYAEQHKEKAYMVNVIGTRCVASVANAYHKKIFYISTDYVFDGKRGNYGERSKPNPGNWYGMTKYAAELEIANKKTDYCIIRTSFRPSNWGYDTAYTNVYTSADYVDIIAKEIALAIRLDVSGIIHIGTETKTFFELAKQRNPDIIPEENNDPSFAKKRFFRLTKWQNIRSQKK